MAREPDTGLQFMRCIRRTGFPTRVSFNDSVFAIDHLKKCVRHGLRGASGMEGMFHVSPLFQPWTRVGHDTGELVRDLFHQRRGLLECSRGEIEPQHA